MTTVTQTGFSKLLAFLDHIEAAKIAYRLTHVRDSIMVELVVPGERWEVEFFKHGEIEIERFVSTSVHDIDEEALYKLVAEYSD